jgi:hypothetical protein
MPTITIADIRAAAERLGGAAAACRRALEDAA